MTTAHPPSSAPTVPASGREPARQRSGRRLEPRSARPPIEVGFAPATGSAAAGSAGSLEGAAYRLKGVFDRVCATLAIILLAPVLAAIALAIGLDSPGPILFRQDRHGLRNRVIRVFKFRTMRSDATDHAGARQVELHDPRITRVGRFLRRTSLDELPQLFNVLRGDMSLVGPRPLPVHMRVGDREDAALAAGYSRRHDVKPGVTGWAQVNGHIGRIGSLQAMRERVACDLYYIDHWSFWFDVRILLLTLRVVLREEGTF